MTDEQIIKALGLCSSEHLGCEDGCPYVEVPCLSGNTLLKDALALVKTKDTEIDILIRKNETLKDENFELRAEVEWLMPFGTQVEVSQKIEKEIKSEAKKEVADSLQSILDEHTLQNGDVHFVALYKAVEKLTKELTE